MRWLSVYLLSLLLLAAPALSEPEQSVVREVLAILHARGIVGDSVETGSAFDNSLLGSERILLQTDVIVRF